VTKAVKAVVAAGVLVVSVEVDTDGKIRVIAGIRETAVTSANAENANEWDRIQ